MIFSCLYLVPGRPKAFTVEMLESGEYHGLWEPPDNTHGDLKMYKLSYSTSTSKTLYIEIRPPFTESRRFFLSKYQHTTSIWIDIVCRLLWANKHYM